MTRFAFLTLLIAMPAPVFADETRSASCVAITAIVSDAVGMRRNGKAQDEVATALEAGDLHRKYIATVQPLVDWV